MALAIRDLAFVILFAVALGLALSAKYIASAVAASLDFLAFIPGVGSALQYVAGKIESGIISPLDSVISDSEAEIAKGLRSILDQFILAVGLALLLGVVVKDAFSYLWNHALRPLIHSITDTIATTASHALARVINLEGTVADNLAAAKLYAENVATNTLTEAIKTADTIANYAKHEAEAYADEAVKTLRDAETKAIGTVSDTVNAFSKSLAAVEGEAAAIKRTADEALADAKDAATQTALDALKAVAIPADATLKDLEKWAGPLTAATLIASIPALATLVNTLATDTGLENQDCRGKVKQICGTNPSAWESLIGSLAAIDFALALPDLVVVGREAMKTFAPLVEQAA